MDEQEEREDEEMDFPGPKKGKKDSDDILDPDELDLGVADHADGEDESLDAMAEEELDEEDDFGNEDDQW